MNGRDIYRELGVLVHDLLLGSDEGAGLVCGCGCDQHAGQSPGRWRIDFVLVDRRRLLVTAAPGLRARQVADKDDAAVPRGWQSSCVARVAVYWGAIYARRRCFQAVSAIKVGVPGFC